jgi:hypothetical protein
LDRFWKTEVPLTREYEIEYGEFAAHLPYFAFLLEIGPMLRGVLVYDTKCQAPYEVVRISCLPSHKVNSGFR